MQIGVSALGGSDAIGNLSADQAKSYFQFHCHCLRLDLAVGSADRPINGLPASRLIRSICGCHNCSVCEQWSRWSDTTGTRIPIVARPLHWAIVAVLLPLALLVPVWLMHTWWWGPIEFKPHTLSVLSFVVAVLIVGEEVGWRGFLLPHLLQRYPPLTSSLILGVVWAVWHLPNFLLPNYPHYGLPFSAFLVTAMGFSVLFTWLYLSTAGSLVIAIIFHAALNLFSLAGMEPSRQYWLTAVVYSTAALLVSSVMRDRSWRPSSTPIS